MSIRFACKCGHQLVTDEKYAGERGKCPVCGAVVMIPQEEARSNAASPPEGKSDSPQKSQPVSPAPSPISAATERRRKRFLNLPQKIVLGLTAAAPVLMLVTDWPRYCRDPEYFLFDTALLVPICALALWTLRPVKRERSPEERLTAFRRLRYTVLGGMWYAVAMFGLAVVVATLGSGKVPWAGGLFFASFFAPLLVASLGAHHLLKRRRRLGLVLAGFVSLWFILSPLCIGGLFLTIPMIRNILYIYGQPLHSWQYERSETRRPDEARP